ncbi:MAG TPA: methyltransferase domain-containing protein [Chloroflexota bacterium]
MPKFTRFRRVLADGFSVHSQRALQMHPVRQGERVLDVGCGFGETTIELARMTGSALGIDCCDPFLAVGRADAARAGVTGAAFELADGQTAKFQQPFDVCFARFGTMFFTNPAAAMANLRRALRPGGRLLMIVWRRIEDNSPFWTAKQVARKHLPPPADEAPSCGPGPFSMADSDTVGAILKSAGWSDVAFERVDADIWMGDTVEDVLAFQVAIGPAGEIVRDAGALGEEKRPLIVEELRETLTRFQRPGGVFMPTSSWCVTARA